MEHWKSKYLEVDKGLNSANEASIRREDREENGMEMTSTGWKAEGLKRRYRLARYLKYTTRLGGGFEKVTGHSPGEYAKSFQSDPAAAEHPLPSSLTIISVAKTPAAVLFVFQVLEIDADAP